MNEKTYPVLLALRVWREARKTNKLKIEHGEACEAVPAAPGPSRPVLCPLADVRGSAKAPWITTFLFSIEVECPGGKPTLQSSSPGTCLVGSA